MQTVACLLALFVVGLAVGAYAGDATKQESCWKPIPEDKQKGDPKHTAAMDKCLGEGKTKDDFKKLEETKKTEVMKCMGKEMGMMKGDDMDCEKIKTMVGGMAADKYKNSLMEKHDECCKDPKFDAYMKCAKTAKESLDCNTKFPGCDVDPDVV